MEKLSGISREWAALMASWDELTALFAAQPEADPKHMRAPKTYDLIGSIKLL